MVAQGHVMSEGHYRWNVDPVWENLSSVFEESHHARQAPNDYMRYKHIRSLLSFASTGLEAFFNKLIRKRMGERGESKEKISDSLKKMSLRYKVNNWFSDEYQSVINIESDAYNLYILFEDYHKLRHGLTHPKDIDHSIYLDLDRIDAESVVRSVQMTLLRVHEIIQRPYPYWLLGWNFVGFNRDPAHPFLSNVAQFRHSLARMELINPADAWDYDRANEWEQRWMSDQEGFQRLSNLLGTYHEAIEPWIEFIPGLGSPPRLCRKWWDREYIISTTPRGR
jgi:hypothetical protein